MVQTSEPVVESPTQKLDTTQEKHLSKPGRTLLVKPKDNKPLILNKFDNLKGLVSKAEINQYNSIFLVFDTIQNSELAHDMISLDYNVKYSYYKIFFTLTNNLDSSNLDKTKQDIINYVESNTDSSMLYCNFYRKDSSYMNCGYLIVDTIEGMKKLISKESVLKQFKTESVSGTFYRFNNTKYKTPEVSHSTNN